MSRYNKDTTDHVGTEPHTSYAQLVDIIVRLESQLNEVDQVLTAFYFNRITLSSLQPVLDLARKRIKVQVKTGRDVLREERRS